MLNKLFVSPDTTIVSFSESFLRQLLMQFFLFYYSNSKLLFLTFSSFYHLTRTVKKNIMCGGA